MKYLIGIVLQGATIFLSKGWGGRVSDTHLTEHSVFLPNVNPGDTMLAHRGFDIYDSVWRYGAK